MNRSLVVTSFIFASLAISHRASAQQEVGHYAPGVMSIRDFIMPDQPGFYGALYSYSYITKRLNDADGEEMISVTINPGPGPGATLNISVDVVVGALAPTIIWVSKWKVLGAKYGAYIAPTLGNTSIGASLQLLSGSGRSSKSGQFGFGDMFVQPVWLTWSLEKADFAFAYGFYAPVGKYSTETVTFPAIGSVTAEASDNIGYGFWTHQLQASGSWYPWTDKRMSVAGALTYEIHGNKKDFDLKPGQSLTFNWGVSQYLPLQKDQLILLEVGPAGYSSWQVTNDSGVNAASTLRKDAVHAAGCQVGVTHVNWNASLNFHYFAEFSAKDRFQGQSIGLNLAKKF